MGFAPILLYGKCNDKVQHRTKNALKPMVTAVLVSGCKASRQNQMGPGHRHPCRTSKTRRPRKKLRGTKTPQKLPRARKSHVADYYFLTSRCLSLLSVINGQTTDIVALIDEKHGIGNATGKALCICSSAWHKLLCFLCVSRSIGLISSISSLLSSCVKFVQVVVVLGFLRISEAGLSNPQEQEICYII